MKRFLFMVMCGAILIGIGLGIMTVQIQNRSLDLRPIQEFFRMNFNINFGGNNPQPQINNPGSQ